MTRLLDEAHVEHAAIDVDTVSHPLFRYIILLGATDTLSREMPAPL